MTRLENVIEQVKDARKVANRPWIFNDDGEVADNAMCCEVLDVLEELKKYEISVSDEWIENFLNNLSKYQKKLDSVKKTNNL